MSFLTSAGVMILLALQAFTPAKKEKIDTGKVEYVQSLPFPSETQTKITYTKVPTPWVKVVNN